MKLLLAVFAATWASGLSLTCYRGDKTEEMCNANATGCHTEYYKIVLEAVLGGGYTEFTVRGCAQGCMADAQLVETDKDDGVSTTYRKRTCCQGDKCNKNRITDKLCYSCLQGLDGTYGCTEGMADLKDPMVILTTCPGPCEKWVWDKPNKVVSRSCKPTSCKKTSGPFDGYKSETWCCDGDKCNHGARLTWNMITMSATAIAFFMIKL